MSRNILAKGRLLAALTPSNGEQGGLRLLMRPELCIRADLVKSWIHIGEIR